MHVLAQFMNKYLFQLGKNPLLSLAELQSVLPEDTQFLSLDKDQLLVETELTDPQGLLDKLGGTIKIAEVYQTEVRAQELPDLISTKALELFRDRQDKVRYALTVQNLSGQSNNIVKNVLLKTKKTLKAADLSSRFINNNFQNPTTALLKGENILGKGAEFIATETKSGWIIGRTVALQDIDSYSDRDYNRPERDPRLGMLPPKLAQIMINLAGRDLSQGVVYDPFCGLGTVLMEAGLMGYNSVGSDIAQENTQKCYKNLEWAFLKYNLASKFRVFNKDAVRVTRSDIHEPISAVVSETFLGPPMSVNPPINKIESVLSQVAYTMTEFLQNMSTLLPSGTPLVLTFLAYQDPHHSNSYLTLDSVLSNLDELGFEQAEILPLELTEDLGITGVDHQQIIYRRPDQVVARAIVKLVKI